MFKRNVRGEVPRGARRTEIVRDNRLVKIQFRQEMTYVSVKRKIQYHILVSSIAKRITVI